MSAVSMLPVMVLAPTLYPGARVLDVCSAPGNKTMQLLERVTPPGGAGGEGGGESGLVVANDAHPQRVKTLQHALARHCRRAAELESLVITCAMGQDIPLPEFDADSRGGRAGATGSGAAEAGAGATGSGAEGAVRGFDAVLVDVPCSGDGTVRKDPDVLRRWHPGGGNALHGTQLAVARRAAALVRPGGALLYSTCSLNPVVWRCTLTPN